MWLVVPAGAVKFRHPGLNRSRENRPKAVRDLNFWLFFCDNCQLVVASDVISGVTAD